MYTHICYLILICTYPLVASRAYTFASTDVCHYKRRYYHQLRSYLCAYVCTWMSTYAGVYACVGL